MKRRLRVPLRIKFMLTFLVLVTMVVGLITFSTANLFQNDKKAYINGLTSMVALGMAEEAHAALVGYRERLRLYARLILQKDLPEDKREAISRTLFDEFPELVAIVVRQRGQVTGSVYNVSLLKNAGVSREDLERFQSAHPAPPGLIRGEAPFVRNTSLARRLPCFTMAFAQAAAGGERALVEAVLLTERLQGLASRFSAYEEFLTDSEGAVLAHSRRDLVLARAPADLRAEGAKLREQRSAAVTAEFDRDGTAMIGGFANVDFAKVLAAAQIPRSAAHVAAREVVNRLILVAVVLLMAAIVTGVLWAHRITRPMERLSDATRVVAKGSFDAAVTIESGDEMGDLASSFNQMTHELKQREKALNEAHAQLVQSEKMAAFGQLGAGIAHEVKNPLAGILACAQLACDDVPADSQLHQDLKLIEKETRRCKGIIDSLLKFARQERAAMTPTDINTVIQDSIAIVNHQLELNQVRVEPDLQDGVPQIVGNANQLQQVFINLLMNAQQAMEGGRGTIRVTARATGAGDVELRFADTGPGIPEEIRTKLFEPFFTTKPPGKGTGLGLSVSYGIIKDHRGEITFESEVGKGTTFVISLPALRSGSAPETSPSNVADAEFVV